MNVWIPRSLADIRLDPDALLGVEPHDEHLTARLGQSDGDFFPDAVGPAGDERGLVHAAHRCVPALTATRLPAARGARRRRTACGSARQIAAAARARFRWRSGSASPPRAAAVRGCAALCRQSAIPARARVAAPMT